MPSSGRWACRCASTTIGNRSRGLAFNVFEERIRFAAHFVSNIKPCDRCNLKKQSLGQDTRAPTSHGRAIILPTSRLFRFVRLGENFTDHSDCCLNLLSTFAFNEEVERFVVRPCFQRIIQVWLLLSWPVPSATCCHRHIALGHDLRLGWFATEINAVGGIVNLNLYFALILLTGSARCTLKTYWQCGSGRRTYEGGVLQ